ncbi:MAG: hypothetical protein H0Z40_11955 [Desulfotomaculum sp.]|nr:hypothetical protein [Desulfotomaculum sp.]
MNQYIEVMKRATELAETCLEGLEHVKKKLNEGHFESTMLLFHDSLDAFFRMQASVQPILGELPPNELESRADSLRDAFELAVSAYEQGDRAKVQEIMQFTLVPTYKKWQAELNRCLRPYLEC